MDLPIEYDGARHGYYYSQEVSAFPSLQISEGELFALLVAEKALQQYRGTSFEKPLVSALKKSAATGTRSPPGCNNTRAALRHTRSADPSDPA